MNYRVALVGNPNSGKTTLFNSLTGSNLYVGNWPGVTIEKRKGICGIPRAKLRWWTFPAFIRWRPIRWMKLYRGIFC